MNDLFKKLNTLVKSSVNDALGEAGSALSNFSVPGISREKMDADVESLRERINKAVEHEDVLQKRVQDLKDEVAELDRQADAAVEQGKEAVARHLIEKMQRTQQRLTMTEADLRQHQIVAQELIQNVNMLEATIADARHAEAQRASVETSDEQVEVPDTTSSPMQTGDLSEHPAVKAVSGVIQEARDRITSLNDKIAAQEEVQSKLNNTEVQDEVDKAAVDDDLTARRSRLSK